MKKVIAKSATSVERRKARLAEALRNNLSLRKARSRSAKPGEDASPEAADMPDNPGACEAPAPNGNAE